MRLVEKEQALESIEKAQVWLGNLHSTVWSFIQHKPVLGAEQFSDAEGLHQYLLDQVASIQQELRKASDVLAREDVQGTEG